MAYLLNAKLLSVNDEVSTIHAVQVNKTPVYAYDVDKDIIVPDARIKRVVPKSVANCRYFTLPTGIDGRNMLELTFDHVILVEINGSMDVLTVASLYDLLSKDVQVRLYKPTPDFKRVTSTGMLIAPTDVKLCYPASFVMDVEFEKATLLPLVSFDNGNSFVIA